MVEDIHPLPPTPPKPRQQMLELKHFLDLAIQGRRRGASSGEVAAAELAKLVLKHASSLDDSALTGLKDFITYASSYPHRARELLGV